MVHGISDRLLQSLAYVYSISYSFDNSTYKDMFYILSYVTV